MRPFSLALRLFVAMFAGHILLDVFGNFVVQGINSRPRLTTASIGICLHIRHFPSMRSSCWSGAIQAYVFALLTSLYINDAVNLALGNFVRFHFTRSLNMELAAAQVIGAGLAAIGVGAAAAGVGYVFGCVPSGRAA